ncbi:MAG: dihydroorotase [Luteibaculaceae bacterium]
MQILIKNAKMVSPHQTENGSTVSILIQNGQIESLNHQGQLEENAIIIQGENLHVSPGLFDFRARLGEPGFEYRETFNSFVKSAFAGGFTGAQIMPNTAPKVDSAAVLKDLQQRANNEDFEFHFVGCLSKQKEGSQLADLFDMHQHGASAFSDDKKSVENGMLMFKALLYATTLDKTIIVHPLDADLADGAQVNESGFTTSLGLRGIPALAETLRITRDVTLAKHHNSKIHLAGLSAKESLEVLQQLNYENVTADVCVHHLSFTDTDLGTFNSNLKLTPPLRGEKDKEALKQAILKDKIQVITSDHTPLSTEEKDLEFEYAHYGAIGLQTALGQSVEALGQENLEKIIECLAINPRKILGLSVPSIREGQNANLFVYQPKLNQPEEVKAQYSESKNSPFINRPLGTKILFTILGNHFQHQSY